MSAVSGSDDGSFGIGMTVIVNGELLLENLSIGGDRLYEYCASTTSFKWTGSCVEKIDKYGSPVIRKIVNGISSKKDKLICSANVEISPKICKI